MKLLINDNSSRTLAIYGFLLFIPGFFVYSFLVSVVKMSPILSGYIPQIATFISLILMAFCPLMHTKSSAIDVLFWGFISFVLIGVLFGSALNFNAVILSSYGSMIVQWVAYFLVFKNMGCIEKNSKIVFISFALIVAFVFFMASQIDGMIFSVQDVTGEGYSATYQDYAFPLLVCTLSAYSINTKVGARLLVAFFSITALFLLGARSELIGCAVGLFIIEVMVIGFFRAFFLFFVVILAVVSTFMYGIDVDFSEINRTIFWIISYLETGDLYLDEVRSDVNSHGWETIFNHPFFGNFGNYLPGHYIHNLFSVWSDFGVIGFIIFLLTLTYPFVYVLFAHRSKTTCYGNRVFAIASFSVSILLLIGSKSFGYPLIAIALGSASSFARCKLLSVEKTDV